MKKTLISAIMLSCVSPIGLFAQRVVDKLDRGLVAVNTSDGVFLSWRVLGEEYYDVTYNVYRSGAKVNDTPLTVSNYTDTSGSVGSTYTVRAVVRGTEQSDSKSASVLENAYLELPLPTRTSVSTGSDITSCFEPNDATIADVDGDGEMEILIKMICTTDSPLDGMGGPDYDRIEVLKLDGTLLWWIDCGPNLCDFQHNETNIAAYDWDGDGRAECVMRAADGTVIHMSDGTTHTIGDASKNYRSEILGTTMTEYFVHSGDEFLVYMDGLTGKPYSVSEYPLKRLEDGETSLNSAWGDSYGHRSTKHFFGAPYLDGRHPSIFLARGIYTRHKMIAYDVDPSTHKLTVRWQWACNDSSSPWYGEGYHNYSIADVDWDGRDEICFGSMVIDDNGCGLNTTGLGHGDAQHVGDFNPYVHGQEIFACNEDKPSNNYRDATTGKIYYRMEASSDDGRCIMGNFSNDYPGAIGCSAHDTPISAVSNTNLGLSSYDFDLNFRIYWDGDLLEETFNGNSTSNSSGRIHKMGGGNITTLTGSLTNNDTKATPCFSGDIFGDWREEVMMRTSDNHIRIYISTYPTEYRNYTLLHDHQYRNAMVWQMNGYNQPPHTSYFLGELEGVTSAPPPLIMTDRTEVADNGSIGASLNDRQVIMAETGDMTVSVESGASPYIFFDNAPTWVQGHDDNDNITCTTYTHTLTGGAFTGSMRLIKQGDGVLTLPAVAQEYTGNTDIHAGVLNFDGTLLNSSLWLGRFAELNSGGSFRSITAEYASIIRPGGADCAGAITADTLNLNFGARIMADLYSENFAADQINVNVLNIQKQTWPNGNGPEYDTPVLEIVPHYASGETALAAGEYCLGEVREIIGGLDNLQIEGISTQKGSLSVVGGKIYLTISSFRDNKDLTWVGNTGVWDFGDTYDFIDGDNESEMFVSGDNVVFDDTATSADVEISGSVAPATVIFNNTEKEYTLSGTGYIEGDGSLTMSGSGNVNINNTNRYTGGTDIKAGTITVSSLANANGADYGALGGASAEVNLNGGTLSIAGDITTTQPFTVTGGENYIDVPANLTLAHNGDITSPNTGTSVLTKKGKGALTLATKNTYDKLYIEEGAVYGQETGDVHAYPNTVVLAGGTLHDADDIYTYSTNNANYVAEDGTSSSWYLDERCGYTGTLTGAGTLTMYATGPRQSFTGNWANFTGTVNARYSQTGSYTPEFTMGNAGLMNGTLNVGSGVTVNNSGKAFAIGNLTGSGVLSGSGRYTIGYRDETVSFSGTFSSTTFTKVGAGSWKMAYNSSNVFSGDVYVNGGTLNLNDAGNTGYFFGTTYNVNVADSGYLAGKGKVYRAYIRSGGALAPGDASSSNPYGALTFTYAYIYEGATVEFHINTGKNNDAARSYITVGNVLENNGTVKVTLRSSYTPAAGDSAIIWTCGTFRGTPTFDLPDISSYVSDDAPYGLKWDIGDTASTTGILRVVARTEEDATGIRGIAGGAVVHCEVYTVMGAKVADFDTEKSAIAKTIRIKGAGAGTYIVRITDGTATETMKVAVK